ncbi:MAG: S1C family serine protease [Candidatus Zipacnadales bacterium]
MQSRREPAIGCVLVVALLAGGVGGLIGGYYAGRTANSSQGSTSTLPLVGPASGGAVQVKSEDDAVVQAVQAADPAVVKVIAREEAYVSPFDYWLGLPPQIVEGLGSGFIFQYEDGRQYVLTNTHVIADARQIVIKLLDGRELAGELAGAHGDRDIAVIRLVNPPGGLPNAKLGDSSQIHLGERVIAIGHPFDFEHTVTVGYVSAIGNRQFGKNGPWRSVIQTDAAINQGNSGGPLVNLAGAVIGINTMIYSPTGAGNIGLGFAIPINEAKEMLYFLVNGGPWVGIQEVMPNSQGFAAFYQLGSPNGVVILSLYSGSPAAQAGLRPYDVILEVDGKPVRNGDELRSAVFAHRIGDIIVFRINRGRQTFDVQVRAGKISGMILGG